MNTSFAIKPTQMLNLISKLSCNKYIVTIKQCHFMFKGTKNIIIFEQSLHFVLSPGVDPLWFPPFYGNRSDFS